MKAKRDSKWKGGIKSSGCEEWQSDGRSTPSSRTTSEGATCASTENAHESHIDSLHEHVLFGDAFECEPDGAVDDTSEVVMDIAEE